MVKLIVVILLALCSVFAYAVPVVDNLQPRSISAQAAKGKLIPIPRAKQFCINYLHGQTPPQSTVTLSTSTVTQTSTPLSTATATSNIVTSQVKTVKIQSTATTTEIITEEDLQGTTEVYGITRTVTVTATPPARRAFETEAALIGRGISPFAEILGLPSSIIKDACFLYLYGVTQYPAKTVTPAVKTVTATAPTSYITKTVSTTSTQVSLTQVTSVVSTQTVTSITTIEANTETDSATTVTVTTSAGNVGAGRPTSSPTPTSQPFYLYSPDISLGISVDLSKSPAYFSDDSNNIFPYFVLREDPSLNNPANGVVVGYVFTSGTSTPGTKYAAYVDTTTKRIFFSTATAPGTNQVRLTCALAKGSTEAFCAAQNANTQQSFYACANNVVLIANAGSPPNSGCQEYTNLGYGYTS